MAKVAKTAGGGPGVQTNVATVVGAFFHDGPGKTLGARMDDATTAIAILEANVASMKGLEDQIKAYLEGLQGDRPKEGQAIQEYVQSEIGQVREMVRRFEADGQPVPQVNVSNAIPFTIEMRTTLAGMEQRIAQLDNIGAAHNHLATTVNLVQTASHEHQQRIINVETQVVNIRQDIAARGNKNVQEGLNLRRSGVSAAAGAACCGSQAAGPPPPNPGAAWGGAAPPGIPTGGAGSSGDGDPQRAVLAAVTGGNGRCHCVHVSTLIDKVGALEARSAGGHPAEPGRGLDPWHSGPHRGGAQPPPTGPAANAPPQSLPLKLKGPLGAINVKDRGIFDEKLATQAEYKFDGMRGGVAWKGKTERHFVSRAPIIKDVLKWAEECELEVITVEKFLQAAGDKLDEEQVLSVNAAL